MEVGISAGIMEVLYTYSYLKRLDICHVVGAKRRRRPRIVYVVCFQVFYEYDDIRFLSYNSRV